MLDSSTGYESLDFEDVDDIKTFNKKFWKADSTNKGFRFVAKFDFQNGNFSEKSNKGIKLQGLPYQCLVRDCSHRSSLRFHLSDTYEILSDEMEVFNEKQVKQLVKVNILNYGKDPTLSDNPQEAAIDLFFTIDQQISKSGPVIKIIAEVMWS